MTTPRECPGRAELHAVLVGGNTVPGLAWIGPHLETCPDCQRAMDDLLAQEGRLLPTESPQGLPEIPGYRIERELGRGGMGVVYLAEQQTPRRRVALKMLSVGNWTGYDLARFRDEAQAIAEADHPNIVPIHDVGEYREQPYFTMRLCPTNLQQALSKYQVPSGDRGPVARGEQAVARFLIVLARAVQHLHDRALLHRDLKPANILLDDAGTPLIADLGLVRRLTEAERIETAEPRGTPAYMPPEQTVPGAAQTVAVDVYGLGGILYALLTGRPPFTGNGVVEILQRVRQEEPPAPRGNNPLLSRDLESICRRCLHKNPQRRYATARDLADDLERFLRGEPVVARPISRLERLGKWILRHRLPSLLALVTVLASTVLLGQWAWYTAQVRAERDRTERHFQTALDNIAEFEAIINEVKPLASSQSRQVRKMTEATLANYQRLVDRVGSSPRILAGQGRLLNTASDVYFTMGDNTRALETADRARAIHRELLSGSADRDDLEAALARSQLQRGLVLRMRGRAGEALAALDESWQIRSRLAERMPPDGTLLIDRAASAAHLAILHSFRGDWQRGTEWSRQAKQLREAAVQSDPQNPLWHCRLLDSRVDLLKKNREQGDESTARKQIESLLAEIRELAEREPDLGVIHQTLVSALVEQAGIHEDRGDIKSAAAVYDEALALAERMLRADPDVFYWQGQILMLRSFRAGLQTNENFLTALVELQQVQREQLTHLEPRRKLDPENVTYRVVMANHQRMTDPAESLRLLDQLIEQDPENAAYQRQRVLTTRFMEPADHDKAVREFIAFFARLHTREATHRPWLEGLGDGYFMLAELRSQQNRLPEAILAAKTSAGWYRLLTEQGATSPRWLDRLARSLYTTMALSIRNDFKSLPPNVWAEYLKVREDLVRLDPDGAGWRRKLAEAYTQAADWMRADNRPEEARAYSNRALEAAHEADRIRPLDPFRPTPEEKGSTQIGVIRQFFGRELVPATRRVIELGERLLATTPEPREQIIALLPGYVDLVRYLEPKSRPTDTAEVRWALRRVLSLLAQLEATGPVPPALASLAPRAEAYLAELPTPGHWNGLSPEARTALQRLDYPAAVLRLLAEGHPTAIHPLLTAEWHEAEQTIWTRPLVQPRLVPLLLQPR